MKRSPIVNAPPTAIKVKPERRLPNLVVGSSLSPLVAIFSTTSGATPLFSINSFSL